MSCPKCETGARRKRWAWWAGVLVLLLAGAWLDRSRSDARAPAPALPAN